MSSPEKTREIGVRWGDVSWGFCGEISLKGCVEIFCGEMEVLSRGEEIFRWDVGEEIFRGEVGEERSRAGDVGEVTSFLIEGEVICLRGNVVVSSP